MADLKALKKRARVSNEFKVAWKQLATDKLRSVRAQIQQARTHAKKKKIEYLNKRSIGVCAYLLGNDGKTSGFDIELSRLRALKYEEFFVVEGGNYFVGNTGPITINPVRAWDNENATREYNVYTCDGYNIYINATKIVNMAPDLYDDNLLDISIIPVGGEHLHNRHRQQSARDPDSLWRSRTITCWGNFNVLLGDYYFDCDIPSLFSFLYTLVSQYTESHTVGDRYGYDGVWHEGSKHENCATWKLAGNIKRGKFTPVETKTFGEVQVGMNNGQIPF